MTYGLFALIVIVYAACNVLRGSGKIKKVIVYAGFALLFAVCIYSVSPNISLGLLSILAILSFAVDYGCNSFGWGDFFPHGRKSDTGDFLPARMCADLVSNEYNHTKNWQTWAMTFRFLLTFGLLGAPAFAIALGSWTYLLAALPFLLSGLAYRLAFLKETKHSVPFGELFNGCITGGCRGAILFIL